jgi:long-chain acyl-CoA synthetase
LSNDCAHRLRTSGIQRGDRVAIMLANVPAFVVWYYATLRLGAIAVSISTRLADREVAFVISDCEARAFITDAATMSRVGDSLPATVASAEEVSELGDACGDAAIASGPADHRGWIEAEPDEAALILYTSGTTGFAKGATLSHGNVRSNVTEFNRLCRMQCDDRILVAVPLFHCFGQNALMNSALNVGATLVLQRKFDPQESKRLISDERVTQLYGVPTMFQLLYDACRPSDLASVKYCFSAAATLPLQVSRRWHEKFGMPIHEGYGLTETSPFASYNHESRHVPGSIGTPIDSVEMKIIDPETGQTCPPGELGEIAIRGPNVMLGYWNRPADTADAIRDGWFHSGDIGRMDEHGYFYIVDRVKDMIAVGGTKVFPAEVERVLLDHPAVSQVAVVGLPDQVFGEQVVAFVVLRVAEPGGEARGKLAVDIKQQARRSLANYKVPQHVFFLDELPRNPSGKVLKTKLREFDIASAVGGTGSAGKAGAATTGPLREPTLRKRLAATHAAGRGRVATEFLQELVKEVVGSEDLPNPEDRFLDAGLDSLMIVELSSQIQAEVGSGFEVPATLVFDHPRIVDLGDFLVETIAPGDASPERATAGGASSAARSDVPRPADSNALRREIESMTEEQVLAELLKEMED